MLRHSMATLLLAGSLVLAAGNTLAQRDYTVAQLPSASVAINDSGQILADTHDDRTGICGSCLLTPVPEPDIWLMLGCGAAVLLCRQRPRRTRVRKNLGSRERRGFLKLLLAPMLLVATASNAQQLVYEMTLIPHFDYVGGINDLGQMAGNVLDANNDRVPVVWTPGATKPFRFLGTPADFASDINNAGQVAGEHQFAPGQWRAAIFHDGRIQDLGGPDGVPSIGRAINASGQVAGALGIDPLKPHAFLYANGQMTDLGAFDGDRSDAFGINDTGQVVGTSLVLGVGGAPNTWRAFEYSNGTMNELELGDVFSIAWGINNAGQVVGEWAPLNEGGVHAFVYQAGRLQDLGNLGGDVTYALSINERGDIVGYGTTGRGDTLHGFIYIDGKLVDVNTLLVAPDGWEITGASAINEERQIVSLACRIDSRYDCMYALLSPVPEPAAPVLWSAGLLLLASRWVLRRPSACKAVDSRAA